ncbi:MAG: glycosyltransferase family 1 protein [Candidatus Sungbacteria bacterium]|uniref:Glycosyltransferase family 1 protein n=1 Tax=Candidatus Sungiibacteriota bacterium TaxID=2750080 RepID=A0A932YYJ4_9BACT|nr:glycosyltransferase family 1 protein [Candidatus Sungbacteria bacterium]
MKIKNLLFVPEERFLESPLPPGWRSFLSAAARAAARHFSQPKIYSAELIFYGDLPALLGGEHVFSFGRYLPHFLSQEVPPACPYPSCIGAPPPTFVGADEAERILPSVDALLVSAKSWGRAGFLIAAARRRAIPVAVIDVHDHPSLYGGGKGADTERELFRGLVPGRDFDLYFKKELPLGYRTDLVFPLAPSPVRPASYAFDHQARKKSDVFYSGRPRPIAQPERQEVVSLVRDTFPSALILEHTSRGAFLAMREYWDNIAGSRMALSPSGISWDSYRHCEVGLAPRTLLIAAKPYIETAGPPLRDGQNAVLYAAECRDGRYHLKDAPALLDKIRHYLAHPAEREAIADRWAADVRAGHTVLARSRYILEAMERAF